MKSLRPSIRGLGHLAWHLDKRHPRIAQINLEHCFTDRTPKWLKKTAKGSVMEMLTALVEAPRLWHLSRKELDDHLENPAILEEIISRYHQGNGLVIAAPHLGSWEYIGLLFAAHTQMTNLYRPPRMEGLNDFIKRWPIEVGHLAWHLDKRHPRIAQINLEHCFTDRTPKWLKKTAKGSVMEMLTALVEAPRLWHLSRKELDDHLENPAILEEIISRYHQGNGLVIAAPHLGSWEYIGLLFAAHTQMTNLYRPPRMEGLNDFIKRGRKNSGAELVPTDGSGIRALSKALSKGECTGILPDQEPESGSGEYADFFGRPAYTMYLLPRLVRKRKTPVAFIYAERLDNGRFRLHYEWADSDIYSTDAKTACRNINRHIENLVRQNPEQYNWTYKRFRTQADGTQIYR